MARRSGIERPGSRRRGALVEMVCNLTIGKPAHAEHEAHATRLRDSARALRRRALQLAEDDARAFEALMASYRLPRESDADDAVRAERIEDATVAAARVPLRIAEVATAVIDLADQLPGHSNPNVLSDVGVAASSAASALESAAINVEVNLPGIRDPATRSELTGRLATQVAAIERARRIVADVRVEVA